MHGAHAKKVHRVQTDKDNRRSRDLTVELCAVFGCEEVDVRVSYFNICTPSGVVGWLKRLM